MKIENDKYYTPKELAKRLINKTFDVIGKDNISEIIEPSAGDGSFSSQIENINAIIVKSENPDNNFVNCEKSETFENEVINLTDNFNHSGNLILVTSLGGE